MTTLRQLKKGNMKYCIQCGRKFTKKEAATAKKTKLNRRVSLNHRGCCGATRGYRCDECNKEGRWFFAPRFKNRFNEGLRYTLKIKKKGRKPYPGRRGYPW